MNWPDSGFLFVTIKVGSKCTRIYPDALRQSVDTYGGYPMFTMEIQLLGRFQLTFCGEAVTSLHQPRLQTLVATLVLQADTPISRQSLAFLFWPDSSESQARTNLRNLLYQLRQCFSAIDHFLSVTPQTLQWRLDRTNHIDVLDFCAALQMVDDAGGRRQAIRYALELAIQRYTGALLPHLYDEWIANERERLHLSYQHALERLVTLLETERNYEAALIYAERLLTHDPLCEESYRTLMRLHMLNNDRASALHLYDTCVATLARELDIPPMPATQALAEQVRTSTVISAPLALAAPPPIIPLVGRQKEWRQLLAAWQRVRQGHPEFVMIHGDQGVGKTRLAEELRQWTSCQGLAAVVASCYQLEGSPAYAPLTAWLRAPPLQQALGRLDPLWRNELAYLLPELCCDRNENHSFYPGIGSDSHLGKPIDGVPLPPVARTSRRAAFQRQRLFEAMRKVIQVTRQPLLMVLDDLHSCDSATIEWLHYLFRVEDCAQILLVCTMDRVAYNDSANTRYSLLIWRAELAKVGQLTEVVLAPLRKVANTQMAESLLGRCLNEAEAAYLYAESEGNPLFLRELVEAGILPTDNAARGQSGGIAGWRNQISTSRDRGSVLPSTLTALLVAQLHTLTPVAQEIISTAAIIGRDFTLDLLATVSDMETETIIHALDEAGRRRIIDETALNRYRFTHGKLQQVAAAQLSHTHRNWLRSRLVALKKESLESSSTPHHER